MTQSPEQQLTSPPTRNQSAPTVEQVREFLDGLHLDVQTPGGVFDGTKEEYIIRMITRTIVALCTAWWSTRELIDYLQKRNQFIKGANS